MSEEYIKACSEFMGWEFNKLWGYYVVPNKNNVALGTRADPITNANQRDGLIEKMGICIYKTITSNWVAEAVVDGSLCKERNTDRTTAILMCIGEVIGVTYTGDR